MTAMSRRIVTTTSSDESVVFSADEIAYRVVDLAHTPDMPSLEAAEIDNDPEIGARWRIFRYPPFTELPLHSTPTTDYLMVLEGQLDLVLPDGSVTVLDAGDCVVQRGAVHGWRTREQSAVLSAIVLTSLRPERDGR
jgi:hypothetical protein